MDDATDAEIARLLAEDHAGYLYDQDLMGGGGSEDDPDYGSGATKKKSKKKQAAAVPEKETSHPRPRECDPDRAGDGDDAIEDVDVNNATATGRRKRRDTGAQRSASRAWSDEEERLFIQGVTLHGRDWKKCAEHIATRDHRAVASHAQKYLIKSLLKGQELPGRLGESGRGYTLSGKPLDPNSASARAYGLKGEPFQRVVDSGFLQVGIHVTTLELTDTAPPPAKREPKPHKATTTKRARPSKHSDDEDDNDNDTDHDVGYYYTDSMHGDQGNLNAALEKAVQASLADVPHNDGGAAEPTEYAKNRPRRQVASTQAQLGATTESLDLTMLNEFVGAPGTGGPLAQPFTVIMAPEAALVMDFHAHLSTCEVIGLLGGVFEAEKKSITIAAAYPCRRAAGTDSNTSVELDAASQVEVTCAMEEQGLIPVGWYHSHPVFEPRPSAKDNENQRNYQALCRDQSTGLEPWIGAIVGPYDRNLPTTASKIQLWVVRQQGRELVPYTIRAHRRPPAAVPAADDDVDRQLAIALEQTSHDMGRIQVGDVWRRYARIVQGQPEYSSGAVTMADKIQSALHLHLPSRQQPGAVAAFMQRLRGYFQVHWGVDMAESEGGCLVPGAALPVAAAAGNGVGDGAAHSVQHATTHCDTGMTTQQNQHQNQTHEEQQDPNPVMHPVKAEEGHKTATAFDSAPVPGATSAPP